MTPRDSFPGKLLLVFATCAATAWIWRCWCLFPWELFNEVRLEPSFLLAHGLSVYPAPDAGPVTTWIYGPLSVFVFLPVTFAPSAASALLSAGAINFLLVALPLAAICAWWPPLADATAPVPRRARLAAFLLCLALWPSSSFQYLQADNAAVACGLLANLALARSSPRDRGRRWLAAALALACLFAKQTALEIVAAQLVWIAWREGTRAALAHFVRAAVCAAAAALGMLALFDAHGLWFNLIELPGLLPWADAPLLRLRSFGALLALHVLAPALVLFVFRRRIVTRAPALSLAALSWLVALPAGLASLLKTGGSINSLHGLLYLLPPLVLAATACRPRSTTIASTLAAACAAIVLVARLSLTPHVWQPLTAHLREADAIAARSPETVWFPWNPLVTFYREHRFDHAEDGLYVRLLAGRLPPPAQLRRHLPPRWNAVALGPKGSDWGLALDLLPGPKTAATAGIWNVYTAAPSAR